MRFLIRWPDESLMSCYSPSLVVREHLVPGTSYALSDFVERTRTALTIASQRVEEKYGMPCVLAERQLAEIERKADDFVQFDEPRVRVEAFEL